jgi:hypothetical protein
VLGDPLGGLQRGAVQFGVKEQRGGLALRGSMRVRGVATIGGIYAYFELSRGLSHVPFRDAGKFLPSHEGRGDRQFKHPLTSTPLSMRKHLKPFTPASISGLSSAFAQTRQLSPCIDRHCDD